MSGGEWADGVLAKTAPPPEAGLDALKNWLWTVVFPSLEGQSAETVKAIRNALSRHLKSYGLSDAEVALFAELPTPEILKDEPEKQWEDPIPLGPERPQPLPLDVLPGWLRAHVESVAQTTQSPSDMACLMALSAVATAVAGKARIWVKPGYSEPLNIWTCTVLPPANRKSSVAKLMARPIYAYEKELAEEARPRRRAAEEQQKALEEALGRARKDAARMTIENREMGEKDDVTDG